MTFPNLTIKQVGAGLTFLSLIFIIHIVFSQLDNRPSINKNFSSLVVVLLCFGINCAMLLLLAFIWKSILTSLGTRLSMENAFIIMSKSQASKYIPGNIFQFVSRVTLSISKGVSAIAIISSLVYENMVIIIGSFFVGFQSLIFFGGSAGILRWHVEANIAAVLIFFLFCSVLIPSLIISVPRFRNSVRRYIKGVPLRRLLWFILLVCFGFQLYGISLKLLTELVFGIPTDLQFIHFSSGFAFAWLLGYLTPGSPGGIGIRETAMIMLFEGSLDKASVVSLALMFRLINVISDLLCLGAALLIEKIRSYSLFS